MKMRRLAMLTVVSLILVAVMAVPAFGVTSHGNGGTQMPAYYDHEIFTITFMELRPTAEAKTLLHNGQHNFIYQSDDFPAFISVIDAIPRGTDIPANGMNPLWNEVQIHWNVPHQQYYSDDEILAAAARGDITLEFTNEMYICAVTGHKHQFTR